MDKHLAFYDWTLIGRIKKAFHKRADQEAREELESKFNEVIKTFSKVRGFDEFRNDFTNFYDELAPYSKSKLKIDFKPFSPANYFKTLQITASEPTSNLAAIDLDELGEGARNLVLLSLLRSYAKNFKGANEARGILALEEPELFLHPQARRHLFNVLHEISRNGIQVIISTHSSSFIDTEYFNEIGRVVKVESDNGNEETVVRMTSLDQLVKKCIETGVPSTKVDRESIVQYYKTTSNPRLNEGFFARCLILVEGETEELTFPELLKSRGVDCDALGVSVIAVNGKNQMPKYWRLYSSFDIPIIVVVDNDNVKEKENSNKNISTCFGVPIEQLLRVEGTHAVVHSPIDNTPLLILDKDFEAALMGEIGFELYSQYMEEARNVVKPIGNQQKGILARYVVRRVIEDNPDYSPKYVDSILELLDEYIAPSKVGQ